MHKISQCKYFQNVSEMAKGPQQGSDSVDTLCHYGRGWQETSEETVEIQESEKKL